MLGEQMATLEAHQDGTQHRFQAAPWLIPLESKNTTRRISLQAYRQGKRREENRRLSLNNSEDKAALRGVAGEGNRQNSERTEQVNSTGYRVSLHCMRVALCSPKEAPGVTGENTDRALEKGASKGGGCGVWLGGVLIADLGI